MTSPRSKWKVCSDDTGNLYFYNTVTGDSMWELPDDDDDDNDQSLAQQQQQQEPMDVVNAFNATTTNLPDTPYKLKEEYSATEIAVGVVDTFMGLLDQLENQLQSGATQKKKKRFVSAAAETRFQKNLCKTAKKQARIREQMVAKYMEMLLFPSTRPSQHSLVTSPVQNHIQNISMNRNNQDRNPVGSLFTSDDTLRWRLEAQVEQLKKRLGVRKRRREHRRQVYDRMIQRQLLRDFQSSLTSHFLQQIHATSSSELQKRRILLLTTAQARAELERKRNARMEPELLERMVLERSQARELRRKNLQKVFVLLDEAGVGKLHLLQILFGLSTIEPTQQYAANVHGLAELLHSSELQRFMMEFCDRFHMKDACFVTETEFDEFVAILEDVLEHIAAVKVAVKEAEDEIEATIDAASNSVGVSLVRARLNIVSKKILEQELALLKTTDAEIQAQKDYAFRSAFTIRSEQEESLLIPKETWEKHHHHRFIRFGDGNEAEDELSLPLYCCLCRRRKWELARKEQEEQESEYRSHWPTLLQMMIKNEELKMTNTEEEQAPAVSIVPVEDDSKWTPSLPHAEVTEDIVYKGGSSYRIETQHSIDLDVMETMKALVMMVERIMENDAHLEPLKQRVHIQPLLRRKPKHTVPKSKKKITSHGSSLSSSSAELHEHINALEREEQNRKAMYFEEVTMIILIERNRRHLERPLLRIQDAAHNAYIRMLQHCVNLTPFLFRLQFERCLAFEPPQRLVLQMADYGENTGSRVPHYWILQTIACNNESEANYIVSQTKLIEQRLSQQPFVAWVVSTDKYMYQFFAESGMLVECWPIVVVVREYFQQGSWVKHLKRQYILNSNSSYESMEQHVLDVFRDVAAGLSAMHSLGVLHLNINLGNFYISDGDVVGRTTPFVKIGDLLAWKHGFDAHALNTASMIDRLNNRYAPPEAAQVDEKNQKPLTSKVDVWMLGCALFDALAMWQRHQLQSSTFTVTSTTIFHLKPIQEILQEVPLQASLTVRSLLRMLLQPNPAQRPQMAQVMEFLSFAGSSRHTS